MDIQEIDQIILQNFQAFGWEPEDGVSDLKNLEMSEVGKMILKCLHAIDANCSLPHSFPHNMADKFRCAASVTQAIKNLGYDGDLGYQNILYPNEVNLRRLLMFLIEKLPKDSPSLIKEPQDVTSLLKRSVRLKIHDAIQRPWVPSHCLQVARKYKAMSDAPVLTEYGTKHCHCFKSVISINAEGKEILPTLLNVHSQELGREMEEPPLCPDHRVSVHYERPIPELGSVAYKTDIHTFMPGRDDIDQSRTAREEEGEVRVRALHKVFEQLKENLQITNSQTETKDKEVANLTSLLSEEGEKVLLTEEYLCKLKKMSFLASHPEENMKKLKYSLAASQEKEKRLQKQWSDYRTPLTEELKALKALVDAKKDSNMEIRREISALRSQMQSLATDSMRKDVFLQDLRQQRQSLPKGVNRSVYTKQIMDISSKVRKQKQEVDKVLLDTTVIQKEINNLTGKLQRTFAVAEDNSFKAASSNEKARPIYRSVITIHEEFGRLVEVIRETGSIQREIADLQEQVNAEKLKNVEDNLKTLQEDLNRITLENSILKKRLNS